MDNNIRNIKKELRSFAKRCKNIKFNEGLLLAFLMTGMLAFTKNTSVSEGIDATKQEISTSISDLKAVFREAKRENNKLLKDSNLELIQLMEQGDQVVKSPWSSWQFGMNYYYSGWNGVYKGMGDKAEKYPYEGVYTRSSDPFLRSISPYSRNYSRYTTSVSAAEKATVNSATTSISGLTDPSWGIESSVFDQEPILTLNLLATIKPKEINKVVPTVDLGNIEGPGDVSFSITPPNVSPGKPEMKTLTFNYSPPSAHTKPGYTGFNMKFEEYNDAGVGTITSTTHTDKVEGTGYTLAHGETTAGKWLSPSGIQTVKSQITDNSTGVSSSGSAHTILAPSYTTPVTTTNYVRAGDTANNTNSRVAVIRSADTANGINGSTAASANNPFKIYFDVNASGATARIDQNLVVDSSGYRIDDEASTVITGAWTGNRTPVTNVEKAFLTGGSRVGSLNTIDGAIINNGSIGLAGPLVAGLEIQTKNGAGTREIKNENEISDEIEKLGYRGKTGLGGLLVPVYISSDASGGNLAGKYVIPYARFNTTTNEYEVVEYLATDMQATIEFPINSEIGATISRTPDTGKIVSDGNGGYKVEITSAGGGYTGYKTGLVLTADDVDGGTGVNKLTNNGIIRFTGHHSIGIQVDADNSPNANVEVLNASGSNKGIIMGGHTSYGMKLSSAVSNTSTMKNEGIITLGGSNSAGIAVIEDYSGANSTTTKSDVRAWGNSANSTYNVENLATTGIINVGAGNSIGMYLKLNRADAIANKGTINVGGHSVSSTNYGSVGMRVDRGSYGGTTGAGTPIVDNLGKINVNHINSMGMVAVGNGTTSTAIATNKDNGIITLGASDTVGMFAENGGEINNILVTLGTDPTIKATNKDNSVGMYINDSTSKGTNGGIIDISGSKATGVYNSGTFKMTIGSISVKGANATAVDLRGGGSTKIEKGSINVTGLTTGTTNEKRNNAAVGFYIGDITNSGKVVVIGDGTNAPTININDNALLVYNYTTDMNNSTAMQTGKLKPESHTTVNVTNGSVFAFKNISTITDLKNAINATVDSTTGKNLNLNLDGGSSLFTVRNFTAAAPSALNAMKLSDLSSIGGGTLPASMGSLGITVNSGNYKIFSTVGGHLNIDAPTGTPITFTLDSSSAYDRVDFVSSSVTVDNGVTINGGMTDGRIAIAQSNELSDTNTDLVVTNNGSIIMSNAAKGSGANEISATAIAVETGKAINGATGIITMTGKKGVGMYGATDSILENNGTIGITTEGAGMIGANYLSGRTTAARKINITNKKTIQAVKENGTTAPTGVIGIYANNSEPSVSTSDSKIVHDTNALIDFATNNATKSVGIYAGRSTVESKGNMKLANENAGINVSNSKVTVSGGTYELGDKSIGFILKDFGQSGQDGWFDGTGGTVDLTTGTGSVVYYFDNAKADTTLSSSTNGYFNDNLTITDSSVTVPSTGVSYTYIYAKDTDLKYDKAAPTTLTKDKVTFINATGTTSPSNTKVELGSASSLSMNGKEVIGVYLNNGISATNKGTITLNGDKAVALYGENGGSLINEKDITVNTNGVGIYNKGATTAANSGANSKITLSGDFGIGMRSDNASGTSTNTGKIISTKLRAVGMSASGGSNALENTGEINLSGQESIGIHTDNLGTGHEITNGSSGKIILTDATNETKPNIGIYSDNAGDVIKNNGEITAGDQTIGVYSKAGGNVTLGELSKTTVGQNAMGVYTTGGTVTIHDGAAITVGDRISAGKESVGVFYAGSNGTINNSTANITIGEGSIGFVMKGGIGNTLNSLNPSNGTVTLKKESVFIYDDTQSTVNNSTHLVSSAATDERIYGIYTNGKGSNYGNIDFSLGKGNVGIYSYLYDPNYTNNVNEKGEYIAQNKPGAFVNHGIISVSESDITPPNLEDKKYGIGMAAGYVKQRLVYNSTTNQTEVKRDVLGLGHIENYGTIRVTTPNSIGMYAGGKGSKAINHVNGRIELSGTELNVGMFLEDGAEGHNYGTITTVGSGNKEQVGIAVLREATFHNHPGGKVYINAEDGIGIAIGGRVTLVNRGEFVISADQKTATINGDSEAVKADGDGAVAIAVISDGSKIMGISPVNQVGIIHNDGTYDATITYNGVPVPYVQTVDAISSLNPGTGTIQTSSIGLYMDTSGVNATKPVNGIGNLATGMGLKYVDLIVGTEATEHTNEKYLKLSEDLINPYNNMILEAQTHGLRRWQIYSNSLTWMAKAEQNTDTQLIENMYLVKVPYTVWSGQLSSPVNSSDTYNFLDGLDQRYGVEALGTREREVFTKLNSIGNNEHILLSQAFDEMMGHQYGNTQQRMMATGSILDKEFTHLKKEWETKSKESNKIKAFGSRGEYKSNTAGIINYTNNAYGVAYVHEDETIKLGNSTGWYAGVVYNQFKLKDIGRSKENTTMLKAGIFKTKAFDHNGSLKWTISGEGYVSRSDMDRRFLVVDEIFSAQSDYYTYGVALKNELSKEFRTSERTSITPYGSLKMEYGKFNGIKEDTGEIRLEIESNGYYSIKPELGIEFKYKQPMAVRTSLITTLGLAYETELGKTAEVGNRGRVRFTSADWFGIREEKEDRKGNFKADLNLGIENERVGFTLNLGYDTKGENVRGGIGFRAIY